MDNSTTKISVLLVDDSPLVRAILRQVLLSAGDFTIVGEAGDGQEAVRLAATLKPQIITMDLAMPLLGGLEAITQIMSNAPTRILVISDPSVVAERNAAFDAITRGALDLVTKPAAWIKSERDQLIQTLHRLAKVPVVFHPRGSYEHRRLKPLPAKPIVINEPEVIVIGASTGGPRVLQEILAKRPTDFPIPIVIVQHLGEDFAQGFIDWLDSTVNISVREAHNNCSFKPGQVLVGIRGHHIALSSTKRIRLQADPPRNGHQPSIDILFESAAEAFGANVVGILLTGMGSDGAFGLNMIHKTGGITIAQNEASCVVFGMPKVAIELGGVNSILSINEINQLLDSLAKSVKPKVGSDL
ncbi:MAG: chemotaxis-specific protein-glutamate methyltransferase CheB [Deltaproteobacteria bacterium]|nr:chemotaxis-specific protein-glutamate methyltransferase CheB [Deltaproteobacteria bacterium]